MRRSRIRLARVFVLFNACCLLASPALAQGPTLQGCNLLIPEESRIPNYQLLAPQMSFDGRYVSYETLIGERRELHISDMQTWARHQVRANPNDMFKKKDSFESEMDWFPSAGYQNWYVFVTGERNNFDVYLGDATKAQKPIPLVNWESNDHQPVFSPNGKDLAFISTKGRSEGTDLYVILNVDKKFQDPAADVTPIRLTSTESGVLYPAWSPDGKFLTFTVEETENNVLNDGIDVIPFAWLRDTLAPGQDASGQAQVARVTSPTVFADFPRFDEVAASWSPDGGYLAFYMSEHTGGRKAAKEQKVEHSLGVLKVTAFEDSIKFTALEKLPLAPSALDPNIDSFLRGPVWSLNSQAIFMAKDNAAEENPIQVIQMPGGESHDEAGTKLNRDLFVGRAPAGATYVFFSAHDRQTTSIYRCELP